MGPGCDVMLMWVCCHAHVGVMSCPRGCGFMPTQVWFHAHVAATFLTQTVLKTAWHVVARFYIVLHDLASCLAQCSCKHLHTDQHL